MRSSSSKISNTSCIFIMRLAKVVISYVAFEINTNKRRSIMASEKRTARYAEGDPKGSCIVAHNRAMIILSPITRLNEYIIS